MTNYPNSLDSFVDVNPNATTASEDIAGRLNTIQNAIAALEANLGVLNSALNTTIDYKLNNTASIDPGHKHTAANITDLTTAVSAAVSGSPEAVQDIVGAMIVASSSITPTYNDGANTESLAVIADTSIQKVETAKNGSLVGSGRKRLNFIEGTGIALTVADDSGNNKTDVTIASSVAAKEIQYLIKNNNNTASTITFVNNHVSYRIEFVINLALSPSLQASGTVWINNSGSNVDGIVNSINRVPSTNYHVFNSAISQANMGTTYTIGVSTTSDGAFSSITNYFTNVFGFKVSAVGANFVQITPVNLAAGNQISFIIFAE